ncbi:MAG: YihY/virulence factor BrkB family protein [Reichenbachiella sp.]
MFREKLHRKMLHFEWYRMLIRRMKSVRLNKRKTNLYSALVVFLDNVHKNNLPIKASGVAFSFTLAIFPSIIFIFTLIPYVHIVFPNIDQQSILNLFANVMPDSLYFAAEGTIKDIISNKRQGLLSFGVITAFVLSTNGMHGLMNAFNSIYKKIEKRQFIKTRLIAIGLTLMLAFVLFFSIILLVIGKAFLNYLSEAAHITEDYIIVLLFILKYSIIGVTYFLAISLIYYFAPAIHDRWKFFSSGAIFSALASGVVSYSFSIYINNFAQYNSFYGSIGALIALMFWLYLLSYILLLGFEYNASVDRAIDSDKIDVTTSMFEE